VGLQEIVGDANLVKSIVVAAKTSMGMDCSTIDMVNNVNFTQRMINMAEFRKQLSLYLSDKMSVVAPNLSTLIGDTVAARLISKVRILYKLFYIYIYIYISLFYLINLFILSIGWILNELSQGTGIDSSNFRCQEGFVPCSQD
jgi:hypothetical protein